MEQFYQFGLFALVACTLKIVILLMGSTHSKLTSAFNLVCVALIAQNAMEFLAAFTFGANPVLANYFVDGVMFSLYFFCAALVYFVVTVSQHRHAKLIASVFTGFALLVGALHLTGSLIEGYMPVGYTIISIEGATYPVFQAYVLGVMLTSLYILAVGAYNEDPQIKSRSRTTALAIAPICMLGLGVVALRVMGFNSSSAIFMPVASTIFVWVLMLDQRGEFITFKVKWRIIYKLATNIKNLNLGDWAEEVEKQLVLEAMRSENNNKSAAARLLGSNQTTFHRKAEKYLDKPSRKYRRPVPAHVLESEYDYF